jgi:hypothetical protein
VEVLFFALLFLTTHGKLDDFLELLLVDIGKLIDIETSAAFLILAQLEEKIIFTFLFLQTFGRHGKNFQSVESDVLFARRKADHHPFPFLAACICILSPAKPMIDAPHISGLDFVAFSIILEMTEQSSRFCSSLIELKNFATLALFTFVFISGISTITIE